MRAYKAERRRQKIKECRDYKTYERKRKGEGRVKRIRIKQLAKLIRDTLLNATDANVARIVCVVDTTCAKVHSNRNKDPIIAATGLDRALGTDACGLVVADA